MGDIVDVVVFEFTNLYFEVVVGCEQVGPRVLCLIHKLCPSATRWGICTFKGCMCTWSSHDCKVLFGIVLFEYVDVCECEGPC